MDPQRLTRLLDRYAGPLALYAAGWTDAADDVIQEAFVRLLDADPAPNHPPAWLYAVVRNLARSRRRADGRRRRREQTVARLEAVGTPDLDPAEVADALAALSDETREVVVAHVWGELTFAEIARLTNTSASAAHRRYQAGLAALRKQWEAPCSPTK